jgi:hypothetical protein
MLFACWRRDTICCEGRGDLSRRSSFSDLVEDASNDPGGIWVLFEPKFDRPSFSIPVFRPAIAIGRSWANRGLACGDAGYSAAHGPLFDLLVLHFGGIASHEANQLTFGGIIERLGNEDDVYARMVCLSQDHTQVDRISAEAIDGIANDGINFAVANCLAQRGQLGPLPQFRARVNVAVDTDDGPAALGRKCSTRSLLRWQRVVVFLPRAGDAGVDSRTSHGCHARLPPAQPVLTSPAALRRLGTP